MDDEVAGPAEPGELLEDLGGDVVRIDTRMAGYAGITAGYLLRTEQPCLVETGTAYSAGTVRAALDRLGVGPQDLATIVVTHVHLDHAGGVGDLAEAYPRARVVVHESGARHLADPSRLMASARRVFGQLLDDAWGPLAPTAADRLVAVGDVARVPLGGGRSLTALHTPGHARHHIGLLDSGTGDLYVGDAAGVYVPEVDVVRASTPPPDFDLEVALHSLQRFASTGATRILFSHFGPVDDVAGVLDRAADELRLWVSLVREGRAAEMDVEHSVAMVRERTAQRYAALAARPDLMARYEELSSARANVEGIRRWLDRQGGEPEAGTGAAGG